MKTIVLACQEMGCAGLDALLRNGFEVLAVFTRQNDAAAAVAERAALAGIPVFAPDDINHHLWVQRIRSLKPDVVFAFNYPSLLQAPLLEIPGAGCLNLHSSLLPRYRGLDPLNHALLRGERETGVTLHYMTARADDGDIVAQQAFAIAPEDTIRDLLEKAVKAGGQLLDQALPLIKSGRAPRRPQDNAQAAYFHALGPADGAIDWEQDAATVRNRVRALTRPFAGAYSFTGDARAIFWAVTEQPAPEKPAAPGTVISTDPLVIACGQGAVRVDFGQTDKGVFVRGPQLARDMNLVAGLRFGASASSRIEARRKRSVLILGVNGFIGNALSERLLASGKYEVFGMDLRSNHIQRFLNQPGFHFDECDISIHREWIEYHVRKCDIILPLVAIATPIEYTRNPLRVFELDFEENLRVVRYCVKYRKRIIFPSTSEVYGMCDEKEFDEDNSKLVLGPIRMQRWIYSCSKQMLDRVIWAYGTKQGLKFTLFRPFNWIGPRLDTLHSARIGSSRAITQLILNLVEGKPIQLIDGGLQKRCFVDVSDGVECLYRIIENPNGVCDGQIINIGNPDNEASIKELGEMLVRLFDQHPLRAKFPPFAGFQEIESGAYYGSGYQDVQHRRPSIRNAKRLLDWEPKVSMEKSVETTLDFFLQEAVASNEFNLSADDE